MSTATQSDIALEIASDIPESELLARLLRVQQQLQLAKSLYAESDALVLELVRRGFTHAALPDGTQCLLIDNFIDPKTLAPRNVVFRPAGVKRFEIDFTDELTQAKREAKASKGKKS